MPFSKVLSSLQPLSISCLAFKAIAFFFAEARRRSHVINLWWPIKPSVDSIFHFCSRAWNSNHHRRHSRTPEDKFGVKREWWVQNLVIKFFMLKITLFTEKAARRIVYTKTVDSAERARWLARRTPNILHYLPPSNSGKMASRFASVASEEIIQNKLLLLCLLA